MSTEAEFLFSWIPLYFQLARLKIIQMLFFKRETGKINYIINNAKLYGYQEK